MKTKVFVITFFLSLSAFIFWFSPLYAAHVMDVVETDEESASDSLNRVAGEIDLGFSKPGQTYQSINHISNGPIERSTNAYEDK